MKKHLPALILLTALLLGGIFGPRILSPQTSEGGKAVTVTVEHLDCNPAQYEFSTDAEFLRAALEEQSLVSGEEREYGLWLTTVDGETADETAQQWWGYTVNGETAAYGVESQPVTNGDVYVFTLHEGW